MEVNVPGDIEHLTSVLITVTKRIALTRAVICCVHVILVLLIIGRGPGTPKVLRTQKESNRDKT